MIKSTEGRVATFLHKSDFTGDVLITVNNYEKLIDRDGNLIVGIRVPFDDILRLTLDFVQREIHAKIEEFWHEHRETLVHLSEEPERRVEPL